MKISGILAFAVLTAALPAMAAAGEEYFVKEAVFPAGADSVAKIEIASRVVPTPQQIAWQDLGLTAFLHFGVNTFTDREWGDGKEPESVFNPTNLDTDQWVKTLKDAGFRLVMLTAKHHDGFCLWPTATTEHSVKNSPWRDGKGDVVADLRRSCDKYGMKLGLYLSPWDRNAECYGNSPEYNDMFVAQLTELLSNYGRIDEVWFDGACGEGPNGKKQEYDWVRFRETIKRLQPEAVMAITGDDVRWVGNENGTGRVTEWSVTPITPNIFPYAKARNEELGINEMSPGLGSRSLVARAPSVRWWPSEVDVSIRPGWFYHEKEEPKSLAALADIYLNSVGRNSVLLLNVPPDRTGRIHPSDSVRLLELNRWIEKNFTDNLVRKSNLSNLTFRLKNSPKVNCVEVGEDITRGQRVESFEVEALVGGKWKKVARGTTIGYKRILTFPEVKTPVLRIVVNSSRGKANIKYLAAYNITMPEKADDSRKAKVLAPENYKVVSIDGKKEVPVESLAAAFDGDAATFWQSPSAPGEHEVVVDMGREVPVVGFIYTPRADGNPAGTIFTYRFLLSNDGKEWDRGVSGEFSNVVNNPIPQRVFLAEPETARYFRFMSTGEVDGREFITVPELEVMIE